jgi:hypothetical protein
LPNCHDLPSRAFCGDIANIDSPTRIEIIVNTELSAVSANAPEIHFSAVADVFHDFIEMWTDDNTFRHSFLRELEHIDRADAAHLRLRLAQTSNTPVTALAEIIPDNAAVAEVISENVNTKRKEKAVLKCFRSRIAKTDEKDLRRQFSLLQYDLITAKHSSK